MIRDDPSRSELIRVDPTRSGGPSWSGPTFVPAWFEVGFVQNKSEIALQCDLALTYQL